MENEEANPADMETQDLTGQGEDTNFPEAQDSEPMGREIQKSSLSQPGSTSTHGMEARPTGEDSNEKNQKRLIWVLIGIIAIAAICVVAMGTALVLNYLTPGEGQATATLVLTLPATATLAPAATETPQPTASDAVWDRIQEAGQMRVGVSADYPPFSFVGSDYVIDGFDIALIKEIGKRLGIPLDIRDMAFDGLGDALLLEQIDVAIAALSVTPDRQANADFSDVYFEGEDAVLSSDVVNYEVRTAQDLASYRVGVQKGSVYETWLQETLVQPGIMPPQDLLTFETPQDAIEALVDQNPVVDLVVMDALPGEVAIQEYPVRIVARGLNPQNYAIVMPKGALTLQANINEVISQMRNDGTLAELGKKYLDIEPPPPTPETPPPPVGCLDGMAFVQDLNYPDNNMTNPAQFPPNTPFQKGWRLRNVGTCTWDSSYVLAYTGGNPSNAPVGGNPVAIQGQVPPGQTYDIYVDLVTPGRPGVYQSFWSMRDPDGLFFGERIWAGFEVVGGETPQPPAPVIYYFDADPDVIPEGQCLNLDWSFNGQDLSLTRIFRGDYLLLRDMPYTGSAGDCPLGRGDVRYHLVVDSQYSGSAKQSLRVQVRPTEEPIITVTPEPAPVIDNFQSDTDQIEIDQCVILSWSFSGSSIAQAQILRDGQVIASDVPQTGTFQDCPNYANKIEYQLVVDSEFGGSAYQSVFVNVLAPLTE